MSTERATFSLENYRFSKASLDFTQMPNPGKISLFFNPSGEFNPSNRIFDMKFLFRAGQQLDQSSISTAIEVLVEAQFSFKDIERLEDIPDYFYPNAIAILFPYVRAFVSTLTLQANMPALVIPTMNLTALKDDFKNNTKQTESH